MPLGHPPCEAGVAAFGKARRRCARPVIVTMHHDGFVTTGRGGATGWGNTRAACGQVDCGRRDPSARRGLVTERLCRRGSLCYLSRHRGRPESHGVWRGSHRTGTPMAELSLDRW